MNSSSQIQAVNSLTYADIAGLNLGLSRFQGESSVSFLARCYQATTRRRDHSYEGTQDELCLQLGLAQWTGISLVSTDVHFTISSALGLITILSGGKTTVIPTVTMDPDNYWRWKMLSDVVGDLNLVAGLTAALTGPDGPALQIANQSNVFTVVNEAVTSRVQVLAHGNIIADSVVFNQAPGDYNLEHGTLTLDILPGADLNISYQYLALPFSLVCSEVGLFGLVESSLATVGTGSNNVLAYQLREAVQAVMNADRSYWAE